MRPGVCLTVVAGRGGPGGGRAGSCAGRRGTATILVRGGLNAIEEGAGKRHAVKHS